MAEENKNIVTNNKKEEKTTFKKMSEIGKDDVKTFIPVQCNLSKIKRNNFETYIISIPVALVHLDIRLDQIDFFKICEVKGLNSFQQSRGVNGFIRYVTGKDKNDNDYHQVQLFIATGIYFTYLLREKELQLFDLWIKNGKMDPIKWAVCPSKEIESGLEYFD